MKARTKYLARNDAKHRLWIFVPPPGGPKCLARCGQAPIHGANGKRGAI